MKNISGKWCFETLDEILSPKHSALIVVDMQNDFCHPKGHFAKHGKDTSLIQPIIPTLNSFICEAKKREVLTIFVQQTTLPNGMSDSPAWLYFKTRDGKTPEYTIDETWGHQFVEGLSIETNDLVVKKFRSSAFINTGLDLLLRSNGIESVIITGVVTQGCVEATASHSLFLDYYVTVVCDCVASTSKRLHETGLALLKWRCNIAISEDIVNLWIKLDSK